MSETTHRRCTECNHPDREHNEEVIPKQANCSYGYCRCSQLRAEVVRTGTPATFKSFPGFDHATGKWATR